MNKTELPYIFRLENHVYVCLECISYPNQEYPILKCIDLTSTTILDQIHFKDIIPEENLEIDELDPIDHIHSILKIINDYQDQATYHTEQIIEINTVVETLSSIIRSQGEDEDLTEVQKIILNQTTDRDATVQEIENIHKYLWTIVNEKYEEYKESNDENMFISDNTVLVKEIKNSLSKKMIKEMKDNKFYKFEEIQEEEIARIIDEINESEKETEND